MHWQYSAIMITSVAVGYWISRRTQGGLRLQPLERAVIAIGAFCGAIFAAKLPFLFTDWQAFLSGGAWLDSGKTITFGLVGGYAGVEATKWALGVRVKTGDTFAVPVAVAIGIGRFSCFVVGCCHGTPTALAWGVDFGDGVQRHPTQVYEVMFHLGVAAVLEVLRRRGAFRGQLIKLYFIAYFIYRFATEYIRPEPRLALDLTFYQWSSLVFAVMFAGLYWWDGRRIE